MPGSERMPRSLEESLHRLGMGGGGHRSVPWPQGHYKRALDEAYPALAELCSQGVISAIGAGMNEWEMPARFERERESRLKTRA